MRVNVEQKIDAVSENFVSVFESARFDSSKKQRGWQFFVPLSFQDKNWRECIITCIKSV